MNAQSATTWTLFMSVGGRCNGMSQLVTFANSSRWQGLTARAGRSASIFARREPFNVNPPQDPGIARHQPRRETTLSAIGSVAAVRLLIASRYGLQNHQTGSADQHSSSVLWMQQ